MHRVLPNTNCHRKDAAMMLDNLKLQVAWHVCKSSRICIDVNVQVAHHVYAGAYIFDEGVPCITVVLVHVGELRTRLKHA